MKNRAIKSFLFNLSWCIVLIAVVSIIEMTNNNSFLVETFIYTLIVLSFTFSIPITMFQIFFAYIIRNKIKIKEQFLNYFLSGITLNIIILMVFVLLNLSLEGFQKPKDMSTYLHGYSFFLLPPISLIINFYWGKKYQY